MTKLEKVATSHNCNFTGVGVFCASARTKTLKANKNYHVCTVIIVLHIYHKTFAIR